MKINGRAITNFFGILAELVPKPSGCPHGPKFIDECGNDCSCNNDEFYACTFKGCLDGQVSEKPMTCDGAKDLPKRSDKIRVFCLDKKVMFQLKGQSNYGFFAPNPISIPFG